MRQKRKRSNLIYKEDVRLHHRGNMYICKPVRKKARKGRGRNSKEKLTMLNKASAEHGVHSFARIHFGRIILSIALRIVLYLTSLKIESSFEAGEGNPDDQFQEKVVMNLNKFSTPTPTLNTLRNC